MKQLRSILAYDAEWKSPEITEQHAFLQADKLLPEVPGVLYFGFPWATLIDRLNLEESSADSLREAINSAKLLLNEQKYVVTVCQHVNMLKYQKIFQNISITHVFWTHTVKGQDCFPENEEIKIFPFPLFPVHVPAYASSQNAVRKYLYSFVEPESKDWVLGKSSEMILTNLAGKQGSIVIPVVKLDFKEVLNGSRFQDEADIDQELLVRAAPIEFERILQESIFSLCPDGSGSKSTRLWKSICCGAIPVILSDDYLPPGSGALWEEATVSCCGRLEDILALPDRLEAMACDEELIERKRQAMRQLLLMYGPDCFIYDIHKLFLKLAQDNTAIKKEQSTLSYGSLLSMATIINQRQDVEKSELDSFILGCSSRLISDPSGFKNRFDGNGEFRMAYEKSLNFCNRRYYDSMLRNLNFKGVVLK